MIYAGILNDGGSSAFDYGSQQRFDRGLIAGSVVVSIVGLLLCYLLCTTLRKATSQRNAARTLEETNDEQLLDTWRD